MRVIKRVGLPDEVVINKILLFRGVKVMLDTDLAELYGVETKHLKRAVRRNKARFPEDFLIELTPAEFDNLRCQIGTSSWGGGRYLPMAFTEQGVAMLSSVLHSRRAIAVNIQIIRVFTRLRQALITQKEILLKLRDMEKTMTKHGDDFKVVFAYLHELLQKPSSPMRRIGFKQKGIRTR